MKKVTDQIEEGILVCPKTKQRLSVHSDQLVSEDRAHVYALRNGVPFLCADESKHREYVAENDGAMDAEYRGGGKAPWVAKLSEWILGGDFRTKESQAAYLSIFDGLDNDAVCVAVGGGPRRHHPRLINVNIADYSNVDVVGDAYALPFADGSVDAIFCEAVLEHLEFPEKAVSEMQRVLKPGGRVFAATPFLQWYHGYPNHFQNFTLTGHVRLFVRAGFKVESEGTCVGPGFALSMLGVCYCRLYMNKVMRLVFLPLALVMTAAFRRIDQIVNLMPDSHRLASSTYLVAVKPMGCASS